MQRTIHYSGKQRQVLKTEIRRHELKQKPLLKACSLAHIQLPLLSPIINQIDEQISQIIKIIKDILSKHDHSISTKINTIISTIKQKSEELRICSTECTQKLKSLFDPFSVKAYGKIMIFLNKFISSLNDFVFMAITVIMILLYFYQNKKMDIIYNDLTNSQRIKVSLYFGLKLLTCFIILF